MALLPLQLPAKERQLILLLALAALPYWPGAPATGTDSAPVYPHTIYVIDTIGVRDGQAIKQWNACGSVRLVRGPLSMAESTGTITIVDGLDDLPRGGWTGDHGMIFLPSGAWQRSVATIRHELGHALGFGHTRIFSIMNPAYNNVQPVDCEGLRRYY